MMRRFNEFNEAKRVKGIALTQYPPGTFLAATYKNQNREHDWYFLNPKDMPITISIWYQTLYLYSVHKAEDDDWKREKTLKRKRERTRTLRSSSNLRKG